MRHIKGYFLGRTVVHAVRCLGVEDIVLEHVQALGGRLWGAAIVHGWRGQMGVVHAFVEAEAEQVGAVEAGVSDGHGGRQDLGQVMRERGWKARVALGVQDALKAAARNVLQEGALGARRKTSVRHLGALFLGRVGDDKRQSLSLLRLHWEDGGQHGRVHVIRVVRGEGHGGSSSCSAGGRHAQVGVSTMQGLKGAQLLRVHARVAEALQEAEVVLEGDEQVWLLLLGHSLFQCISLRFVKPHRVQLLVLVLLLQLLLLLKLLLLLMVVAVVLLMVWWLLMRLLLRVWQLV